MIEAKLDTRLLTDAIFHRWKIVLLVLVMTPAAALALNQFSHRPYRASARLVIQENRSVNPFLGDMMVDLQVSNRFPVIANVLRSRTVTERMLLDLGEIREGDSSDTIDGAIQGFQDRLTINNSGGGVIRIDIEGNTPQQALARLELAMDMLLDEMLRPQRESLDGAVEFLEQQLLRVGEELEAAENAVREFKEQHAEELPEVYVGNLERYLGTLAVLQQAEADLVVAEGQLRLSAEQIANFDPRMSDLQEDVREARYALAQLLEVYTAEHPQVERARQRVASLEREIDILRANPPMVDMTQGETTIEVSGSGRSRIVAGDMITGELLTYRQTLSEVEALRYRVERLGEQRDGLREVVRSYAGNEQRLNALARDVEAKAELYVSLRTRYEDARMTREVTLQSEASRVWIIESPSLPSENNRRPVTKVAAAAIIAAFLLVAALIATLEFIDPTVRLPKEATEIAGVSVIGVMPRLQDHV